MANQITLQDEIAKLKQSRQLVIIGVLFFALLVTWLIVSLVSSQNKELITSEQKTMAASLRPTLDSDVFTTLENENYYSDADLKEFTIYKLVDTSDGTVRVVTIDTDIEDLEPEENEPEPESVNLLEALNQPEDGTESAQDEPLLDNDTESSPSASSETLE